MSLMITGAGIFAVGTLFGMGIMSLCCINKR